MHGCAGLLLPFFKPDAMRVKIVFPDTEPLCCLQIRVRIGDINYGGHLGNDAILSIMQEARMQWLASAGLTELRAGGHGIIMSDAVLAYRGESFYGDVLEVALFATEISARAFDLLYRITALRDAEKLLIAEGKTGIVCFNYDARKIVPMGESLRGLLARHSG